LAVGAIYGLVAMGFAVIYKATGIVNFAQGEMGMPDGLHDLLLALSLGTQGIATVLRPSWWVRFWAWCVNG
jgi:branched-chain amino acid transport system permease protein